MIFIHVNQHVVRRNLRDGTNDPCITVKNGRRNTYCREAHVLCSQGRPVVKVRSAAPDEAAEPQGLCWIEASGPVVVLRAGQPMVALPSGPRVRIDGVEVPTMPAGETMIRVVRRKIRSNRSAPGEPVLIISQGRWFQEADEALCFDAAGRQLARVRYEPAKPLPCGARCWVETEHEVRLVGEAAPPSKGAAT